MKSKNKFTQYLIATLLVFSLNFYFAFAFKASGFTILENNIGQLNSYNDYTLNPATDVEVRVYRWYSAVPHEECKIKSVTDPKEVKKCTPQVE